MMIGWVSDVLTKCPKTAGPVWVGLAAERSGTDDDIDLPEGRAEVDRLTLGAGMMTPSFTASSTTMASSTFLLFSSSSACALKGRLAPHDCARTGRTSGGGREMISELVMDDEEQTIRSEVDSASFVESWSTSIFDDSRAIEVAKTSRSAKLFASLIDLGEADSRRET